MQFIPYGKQTIDDDDISLFIETLKSDFLTTGSKVNEFEQKIYEISNAKYCVSVSNGTAALHLCALALLNKGDKVLTTPNSFIATSNSILYAHAIPIFVDISSDGSIDLDLCEEQLKRDSSILVTGGGAYNTFLLKLIRFRINNRIIIPDESIVDFKEALIFAFLGLLRTRNEINCLASVTGAKKDSIAGITHRT